MTPEQERKLDHLSERLERLEIFLVGDSGLQSRGLKHKVDYHEKRITQYNDDRSKLIGGVIVISAVFSAIMEWVKHFFR